MEAQARKAMESEGDAVSTRISVLLALKESPERAVLTELLEAFGDAVRARSFAAGCAQ